MRKKQNILDIRDTYLEYKEEFSFLRFPELRTAGLKEEDPNTVGIFLSWVKNLAETSEFKQVAHWAKERTLLEWGRYETCHNTGLPEYVKRKQANINLILYIYKTMPRSLWSLKRINHAK